MAVSGRHRIAFFGDEIEKVSQYIDPFYSDKIWDIVANWNITRNIDFFDTPHKKFKEFWPETKQRPELTVVCAQWSDVWLALVWPIHFLTMVLTQDIDLTIPDYLFKNVLKLCLFSL